MSERINTRRRLTLICAQTFRFYVRSSMRRQPVSPFIRRRLRCPPINLRRLRGYTHARSLIDALRIVCRPFFVGQMMRQPQQTRIATRSSIDSTNNSNNKRTPPLPARSRRRRSRRSRWRRATTRASFSCLQIRSNIVPLT